MAGNQLGIDCNEHELVIGGSFQAGDVAFHTMRCECPVQLLLIFLYVLCVCVCGRARA